MPELNSVREFTALPNTRGVLTLAIFAKTKATTAKLTRILKSFSFFRPQIRKQQFKSLNVFTLFHNLDITD